MELEVMGFVPQCYGANRNAITSGMMTDMGSGLVVNLATLGEPLDPRNVVGTFDSGPGLDPVTVAEQEAFRAQYFERGDTTIVEEFRRHLEGVDVMSLLEIDPSERVKLVTIGGVVKHPARTFSRDYERFIERGDYCIARVPEGSVTWLVLWTVNGGPTLKRLRPE